MQVIEYRQDFVEQVKVRASAASNFTHAEFVDLCAELLGDAEEVSDFEACYFRGTGTRNRALGVDGFAEDDVDGSLRLVIAEYGGEEEPSTLTQTQAKACFSRLLSFCEDGRTEPSACGARACSRATIPRVDIPAPGRRRPPWLQPGSRAAGR